MSVDLNYEMRDELLSHWQIQESLLQNYRTLFLTSQSIIFSIAATNNSLMSFIAMLILGWVLIQKWLEITYARGLDVTYFQIQLLDLEKGKKTGKIFTDFKFWQNSNSNKDKEDFIKRWQMYPSTEIEKLKDVEMIKSRTREFLEDCMPRIFRILWVFLFFIKAIESLTCLDN